MEPITGVTRVLLIDDDEELCDLIRQYFTCRGFHIDIEGDGISGLNKAQNGEYDLLILDVMLPGIDGFEVLWRVRSIHLALAHLPVVMLTAHGDEIDRIVGLELGADDYLPKPFNPCELLARMRSVLRRSSEAPDRNLKPPLLSDDAGSGQLKGEATNPENSGVSPDFELLRVDELLLNLGAPSIRTRDEDIELTATEFDLLHVLMRNAGRVVTRDALSREALGRRLLLLDRSLDLHISRLRRKLGTAEGDVERIKTLRGIGYLLARQERAFPVEES